MKERKIPMRRCTGCMTSFPKKDVVRFVARDGKPVIDLSGRMDGRGAYLCRSIDCFDLAIKKKRLARALGAAMTMEDIAELREGYAKEISSAEVCE
ncbi:MAG: YlxR family protein [Clostridiales bacterium]|nr:YlxR family protein [Clostridiales bacterium]